LTDYPNSFCYNYGISISRKMLKDDFSMIFHDYEGHEGLMGQLVSLKFWEWKRELEISGTIGNYRELSGTIGNVYDSTWVVFDWLYGDYSISTIFV
jgi:hypothetical protein